ncbi:MAG: type II secretion system F family protein, partial [Lachnospiraceae bacterium]|nr:type II secretion system F family protein [Lachnospiraceae bacterium]
MVRYKYKAQDEEGKIVSGVIQANDEFDLHDKLKQENKLLIESKAVIEKKNIKRIKSNALSDFSRNIGELTAAGVSLVKALKIISEDESIKPKEQEIYASILKLVRSGISLSDAMLEQGDAFPPLFINMIKSAETSGNLDKIAIQMASHYDKEYRLTQKVKSSMNYPKILGVLIVIVVAIIMGYVIPQFDSLFKQMESLPVTTKILLGISNFVKNKWYVIIIVAAILYIVLKLIFSIPSVKYYKDKLEIHLPVFGKLRKVIYTARFARTLSSLY